jgi:hypothetical protein
MEVSGQLHASEALRPGEHPAARIAQDAGWALVPVRMLWSKEKFLAPPGSYILAVQYVARRYTD